MRREVSAMMDGWEWFWGVVMMLLLWGALAAIVVFAVGTIASRSHRRSDETTDPQTILENRFARGEISQEEFEERKRALGSRAA
jgi:putative membrane protein